MRSARIENVMANELLMNRLVAETTDPVGCRSLSERPRVRGSEFRQYSSEVMVETKKVTWPGKQEVYGTTVMVILTTFLFGIYFAVCDQAFRIWRNAAC